MDNIGLYRVYSTYRVLYVDHAPDLLDLAKIYLTPAQGITLDVSTSAKEVADSGNFLNYDVIVSGHHVPGIDGIAFLKEVRSRSGNIPFIFFSGQGRKDVIEEALRAGADFYVQQGGDTPAQFIELIHKIKSAIRHRKSAEELTILNRLYSVLSATNRAIVRIRDKKEFFLEICRILVETGGFRMVWIGLDDTTLGRILPVASAGYVEGYLDQIAISTRDNSYGRGPTGTAYRTGACFFSNDILTDPRMEPWRESALRHGYLASAALPFALHTPNAGIITLYAPMPDFFDNQVLGLLEELCRDISFALKTLDDEKRNKAAEEEIRKSEERLELSLAASGQGIWDYDAENDTVMASARMAEIYGTGVTSSMSTLAAWRALVLDEDIPVIEHAVSSADPATGLYGVEYRICRKTDGMIRWIASRGQVFRNQNGHVVRRIGIVADITDRKRAEEDLVKKNEELNILNEELTATHEELRQNIEELSRREQELSTALAEKEVLLSEIHHRVKNNLSAFISLLSLEGSTEDTPAGKILRQDLQNRARSMALIHETLYKTRRYDEVDFGTYLATLVDQIAGSFKSKQEIKITVAAKDITLDLPRATPAGLIVNELVTNSFKYAFPDSFDARSIRGADPAISISFVRENGTYTLTYCDNGIGLPQNFDLAKVKTLGLKLVRFLARHQLHADIEIPSHGGTAFVLRFREEER